MKRAVSFILAMLFILMTYTSCGKIVEEMSRIVSVELAEDGDHILLILKSGENVFKDSVKVDHVKVQGQKIVVVDESISIESFDSKVISVTVDSANQLTVVCSRIEGCSRYYVSVDKKVTTCKAYVEGIGEYEMMQVVSYSAQVESTHYIGQNNPTIKIELENTVLSEKFKPDMITLSGKLASLSVANVTQSGNSVFIQTTGKIDGKQNAATKVTLSADATTSNQELNAAVTIETVGAYVNNTTFAIADQKFSFDVVLCGSTFQNVVGQKVAFGDKTLTIVKVSNDKTSATFEMPIASTNLNEVVLSNSSKPFQLAASLLDLEENVDVVFSVLEAEPLFIVDYVDGTNGQYTANAFLYANEGTLTSLQKGDVTIAIDNTVVTITKFESYQDGYAIDFAFESDAFSPDEIYLGGKITLKGGTLLNEWGEPSSVLTSDFYYIMPYDRGSTWDEFLGFLADHKDTIELLGNTAGHVGSVCSAISGVYTVLGILGIVENTNAKLDKISSKIDQVSTEIQNMNQKLSSLSTSMTQMGNVMIGQQDQTNYMLADAAWNHFLSNYIVPINNVMNEYQMYFYEYILNFITDKNQSNHSLSIYIDQDGNVTLPGAIDGYSINGIKIKYHNIYHLNDDLSQTIQAILKNNSRMNAYVVSNLKEELASIVILDEMNQPVDKMSDLFYMSLATEASAYATQKIGPAKILNAFKNYCDALTGKVGGISTMGSNTTPLDYFELKLSYLYNFKKETIADVNVMKGWVGSFLTQTYALASAVFKYDNTANMDAVNASYMEANELVRSYMAKTVSSNDVYSFVTDSPLTSVGTMGTSIHSGYNVVGAQLLDKKSYQPVPNNIVNTTEINRMYNRYVLLKSKGLTTSASFGTYLVNAGVLDAGQENGNVVLSVPISQDIPLNNTVSLICTWKHDKSSYFDKDKSYSIGTNGKLTAQYFNWSYMLKSDVFDLATNTTKTDILVHGFSNYNEHHIYWFNYESGYFSYTLANPIVIIKA